MGDREVGFILSISFCKCKKSSTRDAYLLAIELLQGLKDGVINFSYFNQKFSQGGTLGDSIFRQFDISDAQNHL